MTGYSEADDRISLALQDPGQGSDAIGRIRKPVDHDRDAPRVRRLQEEGAIPVLFEVQWVCGAVGMKPPPLRRIDTLSLESLRILREEIIFQL